MGISTRGISAPEKPRLVQGVGAGSGEYSPEQQAERRFLVSRLCRVRTLQRLGVAAYPLAAAPAKARRREERANRGGTAKFRPLPNFTFGRGFYFCPCRNKTEVYYDDL